MAIDSTASVAQSSTLMVQQQARLMQAQRSADDAERQAQALEGRVQNARSAAARAQQEARSLEGQLGQADSRVDRARQSVDSARANSRVSQTSDSGTQLAARLQTPLQEAPAPARPSVNTQGQVTGSIINVTA